MKERIFVRFGATLAANLLRAGISFATSIVVARGLGAGEYGNLSFLLGSFAAIGHLLDLGTSSAFYTFISQRQRRPAFFVLYTAWIATQFIVSLLVVGALMPANAIQWIWIGQTRGAVLLACAASFVVTQVWGTVSQLGEAARQTVLVQTAAVLQALAHLVLIYAAALVGWLTVRTLMWLLIAEYALLVVALGSHLFRLNVAKRPWDGDEDERMVGQFVVYCKPLIVYSAVGFLYVFADRWLLQWFGGSNEQAYLAVGQQFASVGLIATTSMLNIFWKEVAESHERGDLQRLTRLYRGVTRGLYFGAAFLCCFLIPYSPEIVEMFLGVSYRAAWPCLAVMLLYPIQQALGQAQNAFFYASRDTKTFARLSVAIMLMNVPLTYAVLASPTAPIPGMDLGAVGLAVRMVVTAALTINLQALLLARRNGWAFEGGFQVVVTGGLLSISFLSKEIATLGFRVLHDPVNPILVAVAASVLYAGGAVATLLVAPGLAGLTTEEIAGLKTRLSLWWVRFFANGAR